MSPDAEKKENDLRCGFTTGAAAAAAVKGALLRILEGVCPDSVGITLLTGDSIDVAVHSCTSEAPNRAVCTVIKDAGDDPDITHKAEIGADVRLSTERSDRTSSHRALDLTITGGPGVGTVTKPGLDVAPGRPAINPGPQKMIRAVVAELLDSFKTDPPRVSVEIFVPKGEELARNTLNFRLGIVGGISILGTTGVVRPMSHEAYIATIHSALSVACATGNHCVVMTTGRRSERFAQTQWPDLPEEAFVQIGDFFRTSLEKAAEKKFRQIVLAVFFGKAVKMAQGVPHTHAAKSAMTLKRIAQWTAESTGNERLAREVATANTARHALALLGPHAREVVFRVGKEMVRSAERFAGKGPEIRGVVFDYEGGILFDSHKSNKGELDAL